jgi:hypothetical protein
LLGSQEFKDAVKGTHVLVAPHHGRESGFCNELFELISPYLVVISDGVSTTTNASSRYSQKAQGWEVHHRSGGADEVRKCLTTRSDGVVLIEFGPNGDGKNFLSVTID